MSKAKKKKKPKLPPNVQAAQDYMEAFEEFADESEWDVSAKGNPWRPWRGSTVTIFSRHDGTFGWSIADGNEVRYSRASFLDEADAMDALFYTLQKEIDYDY